MDDSWPLIVDINVSYFKIRLHYCNLTTGIIINLLFFIQVTTLFNSCLTYTSIWNVCHNNMYQSWYHIKFIIGSIIFYHNITSQIADGMKNDIIRYHIVHWYNCLFQVICKTIKIIMNCCIYRYSVNNHFIIDLKY